MLILINSCIIVVDLIAGPHRPDSANAAFLLLIFYSNHAKTDPMFP